MKSKSAVVLLLPFVFAVCPLSQAADGIEEAMKVLKKTTRDLGRLEGDFAKGESLAREAAAAARKSKDFVPEVVAKMPEGDAKSAALAEYKKQMDEVAAAYDAIEKACQAKDAAKLQECLDKLDGLKKKGHEQFTEEDE